MPLSPDDVFHRPWAWREISRDEATFVCATARVVVTSRPTGPSVEAEWLTPASAFFSSWRPQARGSLRYFLLVEETTMEKPSAGPGGELQGGPADEDQQEQDEVPVASEPPERQRVEEEEPVTLSSDADQEAIAEALTQAAEQGVPFCEECARRNAA